MSEKNISETKEILSEEDLREIWSHLSLNEKMEGWLLLPKKEAEEFFFSLSSQDQAELILKLDPSERRSWIRLLPPDDVADLLQCLEEDDKIPVFALIDTQTQHEVSALLAYKTDAAGGLMSPRYARLRPDMRLDEAISYLRKQATEQLETIYSIYVLNEAQRLLGVLSFRELFLGRPNQLVREIMQTDIVKVPEEMDQMEVSGLFSQYNLLALPVVDSEDKMKGIVTLDDIVDVVKEEATRDIQKFGGTEALDAPYLKVGFFHMIKKRAGWLAVLFVGEMLTATAMGHFEEEIAKAVILALFVPLIISSGGNSGSQASTLVIRALALQEIRLRDWLRVMWRELTSGLLLGTFLGGIGFCRILLWELLFKTYGDRFLLIALTVFCSLIGVVTFGTLIGSMLPFFFKKLRFDPASASAPFVATLVDVTGLIIYFSLARIILRF